MEPERTAFYNQIKPNKVKRSKNQYWMDSRYGSYLKYAWICQDCERAWISREVAQSCTHKDSRQAGHDRFIYPIKLDE